MQNTVKEKSFHFSVRIVKLCNYLTQTKKEHIITKQLLKSGTSIGANIAESQYAQSTADFLSKLQIASKECAETDYWLRLLHATGYLTYKEFSSIFRDCQEIGKMLSAIIKTIKA